MNFEKKKETSKNLFDMVSSKYTKKSVQASEVQEIKPLENTLEPLIKRAKQIHDELAMRIDHLLRFNNITEQKFYKYLSNPKNFTQEEWKNLEAEREANNKRMEELCHQLPSGGEEAWQKYLMSQKKSVQKQEMNKSSEMKEPMGSRPSQPTRKKKSLPKHQWLNMH